MNAVLLRRAYRGEIPNFVHGENGSFYYNMPAREMQRFCGKKALVPGFPSVFFNFERKGGEKREIKMNVYKKITAIGCADGGFLL